MCRSNIAFSTVISTPLEKRESLEIEKCVEQHPLVDPVANRVVGNPVIDRQESLTVKCRTVAIRNGLAVVGDDVPLRPMRPRGAASQGFSVTRFALAAASVSNREMMCR